MPPARPSPTPWPGSARTSRASHRAEIEDLARTVGVRAALPLGVCLLPAFLLIGIVPVVVASLAALGW